MATSHLQPVASRSATNRANALLSTGPRTDSGKQRSSLNALRHGLTAASAVLPSEDQAAFDAHRRGFFDEYQPATPTETQLTQELADTAWRLNRIPLLEASLLDRAANQALRSGCDRLRYRRRPPRPRHSRHALPAALPPVSKKLGRAPRNPGRAPSRARAPTQKCRCPPGTPQTQRNSLAARR